MCTNSKQNKTKKIIVTLTRSLMMMTSLGHLYLDFFFSSNGNIVSFYSSKQQKNSEKNLHQNSLKINEKFFQIKKNEKSQLTSDKDFDENSNNNNNNNNSKERKIRTNPA